MRAEEEKLEEANNTRVRDAQTLTLDEGLDLLSYPPYVDISRIGGPQRRLSKALVKGKGKGVATSSSLSGQKKPRFSITRVGDLSSPPLVGNPPVVASRSILEPASFRVPQTRLFGDDGSNPSIPTTPLFKSGGSQGSSCANSGLGSMLNDPNFALQRTREYVMQSDLDEANSHGALSCTKNLLALMAKSVTFAQSVSDRYTLAVDQLGQHQASFSIERSELNSEIESLRASNASQAREIDVLTSQLRHNKEEMARWEEELSGHEAMAVERFKDSSDFEKICDELYIEGFEFFRTMAQGEWPGINFSRLQLKGEEDEESDS